MSIRPLDPNTDHEALAALYRGFDGKAYQQRVQGIDADKLADFLAAGACRSPHPTWVATEGDAITGIAALQTDHWHREHLGFPVGKVTQILTAPGKEEAFLSLCDAMHAEAYEHNLDHLSARTDGHSFAMQEMMVHRGWYPVGTSVKLVAKLSPGDGSAVRAYTPEDRERLLHIATEGHDENHLHFDPHLPHDAVQAIFKKWVEKCLDGIAAQTWVLDHEGEPAGLCTIIDPKSFNQAMGTRIAVLDYIVLDRSLQGRGLGSTYLKAVHARVAEAGFDQIELRTTATNFAAVNAYTKHGYKLVGTDQVFGKWLG